MKPAS